MNQDLQNNTQTTQPNVGPQPSAPTGTMGPQVTQATPSQPVSPAASNVSQAQPQPAQTVQQPAPQPAEPQPTVQPQYVAVEKKVVPEEYKPITMWGYFGYEILFAIPLVGFILILVFSFGGARNINLRNFARSYFCVAIVAAIIIGLLLILGVGLFGANSMNYR